VVSAAGAAAAAAQLDARIAAVVRHGHLAAGRMREHSSLP